jgi:hypothetical protein
MEFEKTTIYTHFLDVWCNGDITLYNFLMKYINNMLFYPYINPRVSILLHSQSEGAGKGQIISFIENLLGKDKYVSRFTTATELFARFNKQLFNKVLVVVEETGFKDTKDFEDKLKGMITADDLYIEGKGKEIIKTLNTNKYWFQTNNEKPMPVSFTDRRIQAFSLSNKYADTENIDNENYFKKLRSEILDIKHSILFYYYIKKHFDSNGFQFEFNRIQTSYYNSLKECSLPIYIHYFQTLLTDKIDSEEFNNLTGKGIASKDLYDHFSFTLKENGFNSVPTKITFTTYIKSLPLKYVKTGGYWFYRMDLNEMKTFLYQKYKIEI